MAGEREATEARSGPRRERASEQQGEARRPKEGATGTDDSLQFFRLESHGSRSTSSGRPKIRK